MKTRQPFVYFLDVPPDEIKIGSTGRGWIRIAEILRYIRDGKELLHLDTSSPDEDERKLHKYFQRYNTRQKDYFQRGPIARFIDFVKINQRYRSYSVDELLEGYSDFDSKLLPNDPLLRDRQAVEMRARDSMHMILIRIASKVEREPEPVNSQRALPFTTSFGVKQYPSTPRISYAASLPKIDKLFEKK